LAMVPGTCGTVRCSGKCKARLHFWRQKPVRSVAFSVGGSVQVASMKMVYKAWVVRDSKQRKLPMLPGTCEEQSPVLVNVKLAYTFGGRSPHQIPCNLKIIKEKTWPDSMILELFSIFMRVVQYFYKKGQGDGRSGRSLMPRTAWVLLLVPSVCRNAVVGIPRIFLLRPFGLVEQCELDLSLNRRCCQRSPVVEHYL
jgi:hypothetical protein